MRFKLHRFIVPAALLALALLALPAAALGSTKVQSNASTANTYLEGVQAGTAFEFPLSENSPSITCSEATFTGSMSGHEASEIALHPRYNKEEQTCVSHFAGSEVTLKSKITSVGCGLGFVGVPTGEEPAGTVEIGCEPSHKIEIYLGLGCKFYLGTQSFTGFHYANTEGGTLATQVNSTGIQYTNKGCASLLGLADGSGSNGVWSNTINLAGYNEVGGKPSGGAQIWVGGPRSFHSESIGKATYLKGTQKSATRLVASPGFLFECSGGGYEGEMKGASEKFSTSSVALKPEYGICSGAAGKSTFSASGCEFSLAGDYGVGGIPAAVAIVCGSGKAITIKAPFGCTVTIPGQTLPLAARYTNYQPGGPTSRSVVVNAKLEGIHFTSTGCGYYGLPAEGNGFEINSEFTLAGYTGGLEPAPVWLE